jgi:uncharacterized membrane protein YhaH (DUF805 family)
MLTWGLLPLRRYAEFSGRSRRKEFWMFVLFNYAVGLVYGALLGILMLLLYFTDMSEAMMLTILVISLVPWLIYSLWLMIPGLALTVRRLHDLDKSAWNLLWALIPVGGAIALLAWYCTEGTRGPNRFGPDPLAGDAAPVFA